MPFVLYVAVIAITAASALFGLDWMSAPMSAMPEGSPAAYAVHRTPPKVEAASAAITPKAEASAPATMATAPASTTVSVEESAARLAAPKCDVSACASAYRSFDAADCTYQPFDGPRRLCEKGRPPAAQPAPDARPQAACNVQACAQAYISFNAADCTYRPSFGPRRLCEK